MLKVNSLHFLQSPSARHLGLLRFGRLRTCEHEVDVFVVVFTVVVVVGAWMGQRQCWCCVSGINIQWLFNGARLHQVSSA